MDKQNDLQLRRQRLKRINDPGFRSSKNRRPLGVIRDHGILFFCLYPLAFVSIFLAEVGCSRARRVRNTRRYVTLI
jgi:hypothetical protein